MTLQAGSPPTALTPQPTPPAPPIHPAPAWYAPRPRPYPPSNSSTRRNVVRPCKARRQYTAAFRRACHCRVSASVLTAFVNMCRTTNERAKATTLIENGRFAVELLQDDLVHAGFWGGYVPQFDILSSTAVPGDAPAAAPNPCAAYTP